jgi:hypothetical protein
VSQTTSTNLDMNHVVQSSMADAANTGQLPSEATAEAVGNTDTQLYQPWQQLDSGNPTDGTNPAQATLTEAAQPTGAAAHEYAGHTVNSQTPQATAAQGEVDPRSIVTAEQEQVDKENSTVQGQLTQLMEGDLSWANGAMRKANEAMAARGLGASTMAGEAVTNAVMESALPIAQQDAGIFSQFQLANLNARQQASLANAEKYNAVNLANLSNEQQTRLVNQQAMLQTLLSDQAAINAAKQFNASSANQTDQFNAQLASSISQFNASQANATSQFNAGQTNSWAQFSAEMENQRDQFNTTMRAQIDQSNYQWWRSISTAETAEQNAANRQNAQNSFNLSTSAMNNIWQAWRDEADQSFQSSESAENRAYGLAYASIMNQYRKEAVDDENEQEMAKSIGNWATKFLSDLSIFS